MGDYPLHLSFTVTQFILRLLKHLAATSSFLNLRMHHAVLTWGSVSGETGRLVAVTMILSQGRSCGIFGGPSGTAATSLTVLGLPLPVIILPNAPYFIFSLYYMCIYRCIIYILLVYYSDRFCGLVVKVPGYRSRGPGSILGATGFSEK
jgi:hypothetical protein